MLSAFTADPIIELKQRDKSKIESILAHGDQLLVGLSTGSLRVYRINHNASVADGQKDDEVEEEDISKRKTTELLREYENFSKAKIEQLAIFKEANTIICLSGGLVTVHDLSSYELQESLSKTKGATTFAATSNVVQDQTTGVLSLVSRLAVAVKRKLLIWTWHDGELTEDSHEITLVNGIKTLTWATGTSIVVGLSANYILLDVMSEEQKPIIGPGSIRGGLDQDSGRLGGVGTGTMSYLGMGGMIPTPLSTGLGANEMLLARDINSHFMDRSGDSLGRRQIPWKTAPYAVGFSYPFLLSLQEPSKAALEVRNPQTLTLLQSISLPGASLLQVPNPSISLAHQGKGFLVASERVVWRMKGSGYDPQIEYLLAQGSLDEAISLLGLVEETLIDDKAGRLREIKMQKAQQLFRDKKFREALDLFTEVSANPERVIRLYPPLIAGSLASTSTTSGDSPKSHKKTASLTSTKSSGNGDIANGHNNTPLMDEWSEKDLKSAVRELQAFLADCRRRLQRFFTTDQKVKELGEVQANAQAEDIREVTEFLLGVSNVDDVELSDKITETAKLVDTTLFRAHMYATPSLVGPLFRIANFCDPVVVTPSLEQNRKYNDLISFLYGKGLHRDALERLRKLGQTSGADDEPFAGPERTVNYLQNLSADHIDLILEFAQWPMEADPAMAMQIFLADTSNAEDLPREKVLAFLEPIRKDLAVQYLEHVIDELDDATPALHQRLIILYFEAINEGSKDEQDDLLPKFLQLLKESTYYSPAKVLRVLPRENPLFYEATAIVFSKMSQHKQALQIYVFKLHDMEKAEEYCNQALVQEGVTSTSATSRAIDEEGSIHHVLLNLYLNPPTGEPVMIGPAVDLMAKHGPRLPASSTLDMIPNHLLVQELEFYLRGRMRNANTLMTEAKITARLYEVNGERLKAALQLGEGDASLKSNGGRQRKVRVDDTRVCGVCYKRLGSSVISVFPDNSVVHLGCAERRQHEITSAV